MKWAVLFPDSRDPPTLYLSPPTGSCLDCSQPLTNMPHKPTSVKYVSTNVQITSQLKVTVRCKDCCVQYGFEKFGNNATDFTITPEMLYRQLLWTDACPIYSGLSLSMASFHSMVLLKGKEIWFNGTSTQKSHIVPEEW
jgi:hypothetical protein